MTARVGWGGWNGAYVNWTQSYSNNRLTTNPATGATLTYDASGNLTYDGSQSFTYDATGQQATASGSALSNSYDGDRLRVKKVENSATTYYVRSTVLGGQVLAELNASGTWTRGYVYLGGQMVAIQSGGVNWVHQDPITKSQRVTNSSGTVLSTIDVDPWGGETASSSNQAFQPHRFTSYERDANGGDDAMMRRYTGNWMRFAQPDPYDGSYRLSDPQSFNRYSYVQNDPVNFVDPFGLDPERFDSHLGPPPPIPTLIPYGGTIVTNTSASRPSSGGPVPGFFGDDVLFMPVDPPSDGPGGPTAGGPTSDEHPQDPVTHPDHCAGVALNAQAIADYLSANYVTGRRALYAVDARLSQWYVGQTMKSFVTAAYFYVRVLASGGNLPALGATLVNTHWGTGGFPAKFLDSLHPDEDQTHHLVSFLSAGINDSGTSARLHRNWDALSKNHGDARLSNAAFTLGQFLRKNPSQLKNIGALIYTNICLGKAG